MTVPRYASSSIRMTVLGHVCVDENSVDGRRTVSAGSPAVYIQRQFFDRAEVEVAVISPYGEDFALFAAGLPLVGPPTAARTLLYRNTVALGRRTQQCLNVESSSPAPLDDEAIRVLRATDILMLTPLVPNFDAEFVRTAAHLLPSSAATVLLAQGYLREIGATGHVGKRSFDDFREVLPLVDVVVLSDEDADDAVGTASEWVRRIPEISVVVTENRNGATLVTRDGRMTFPADPIGDDRMLDGIGAGDVFSAELALRFHQTRDIADAIGAANSAAARFLLTASDVVVEAV